MSCSDLDITGRTEKHVDEEKSINKDHTADTLQRHDFIDCIFNLVSLLTHYIPMLVQWPSVSNTDTQRHPFADV